MGFFDFIGEVVTAPVKIGAGVVEGGVKAITGTIEGVVDGEPLRGGELQ